MATDMNRITVNVPKEQHDIIAELAQLQGKSKGGVIREMLIELTDSMRVLADVLIKAKTAPQDALNDLKKQMELAQTLIDDAHKTAQKPIVEHNASDRKFDDLKPETKQRIFDALSKEKQQVNEDQQSLLDTIEISSEQNPSNHHQNGGKNRD